MRRAALVGIISMLLATVAAGYLSGVMAYQFLNARSDNPEQVLTSAAEAANAQFLVSAAIMVVGLVIALASARAILLGLGIANPLRVIRGPLILSVVGAGLTVALSLPGVFLILLAGLAWAAYRIFDETFNPVVHPRLATGARVVGAGRGGDLSDWS